MEAFVSLSFDFGNSKKTYPLGIKNIAEVYHLQRNLKNNILPLVIVIVK